MIRNAQIKKFELSDQDALLSFLRLAYAGDLRKSDGAFWKWQYLDNPYTSLNDIPLWIVKHGEQIVGQAAAIPVDFKVEEETRRGIWILDFILLADYRGKGLGMRLLLAAGNSYPNLLALGLN